MSHLSFQDYFILFSKGTVYRNKLHFSKRQDHFNHLPSHTLETTTHMLINLGQTCDEHNVTHHFLVKCFCNCSISNQKCILIFYYICVRKKKKKTFNKHTMNKNKCIQKLTRVGELCFSCHADAKEKTETVNHQMCS